MAKKADKMRVRQLILCLYVLEQPLDNHLEAQIKKNLDDLVKGRDDHFISLLLNLKGSDGVKA